MNSVRRLVSKKKKRYQEGNFDLDLTYVTDRIVAMGFPSVQLEGLYRNKMSDVKKFFDTKHPQAYKVYNLCSEKAYEPSYFGGRVERFPFDDHNAPPFEIMLPFCRSVDEWLKQNPKNIVVVHCKAGKGRTGVMICAYLIYIGSAKDSIESMAYYAKKRTSDNKGVTIPSQIRYIHYFDKFMKNKATLPMPDQVLIMKKIVFVNAPKNFGPLLYKIRDRHGKEVVNYKKGVIHRKGNNAEIICEDNVHLSHDLKIVFNNKEKKKTLIGKDKDLFHVWINLSFVENNFVSLPKPEIDRVHKDKKHKIYPAKFSLEFHFEPAGNSNTLMQTSTSQVTANNGLEEEDPPSPISSRDSDEFTDPESQENMLQELEEELNMATTVNSKN